MKKYLVVLVNEMGKRIQYEVKANDSEEADQKARIQALDVDGIEGVWNCVDCIELK